MALWLVKRSAKELQFGPVKDEDVRQLIRDGYTRVQVRPFEGGRWYLASNTPAFMNEKFDDTPDMPESSSLAGTEGVSSAYAPERKVTEPRIPAKIFDGHGIVITDEYVSASAQTIDVRSILRASVHHEERHAEFLVGALTFAFVLWRSWQYGSIGFGVFSALLMIVGTGAFILIGPNWTFSVRSGGRDIGLVRVENEQAAGEISKALLAACPRVGRIDESATSSVLYRSFFTFLGVLALGWFPLSVSESCDQSAREAAQQKQTEAAERAEKDAERERQRLAGIAEKQAREKRAADDCAAWRKRRDELAPEDRAREAIGMIAADGPPSRGDVCNALSLLTSPAASAGKPPPQPIALALARVNAKKAQLLAAERAEKSKYLHLKCGDGTTSDSCLCTGAHRGCCSRHGGVAGCEPPPADEPCSEPVCPHKP